MTLQEAKDKAAREYGYPNFEIATTLIAAHVIIDRAMEIYASQQRTDGIRDGFDAAREWGITSDVPNRYLYFTVEDYLNQKK